MARRIAVDPDRSGLLADPAAHIEHQYRHMRRNALRMIGMRLGSGRSGSFQGLEFL
jgi:hypothetical protein